MNFVSMVIENLILKRFSCGVVWVRMFRVKLVMSRVISSGSDNCSFMLKILVFYRLSWWKFLVVIGMFVMGRVWKFFVIICNSSRWLFRLMNIMVVSSENIWLMMVVWFCVWGLKKVVKDRFMVELVSLFVVFMVVNIMCMVKFMDRLISNCCSRISSLVIDIGLMVGGIGIFGVSIVLMVIFSRILISMGMLVLLKGGVMDSSLRMCVVG